MLRAFRIAATPPAIDGDPDFNRTSLRGNVVLRWEYVRGSTLFVVWDLSKEEDLGDTLGTAARHVLMVTLTYWLSR